MLLRAHRPVVHEHELSLEVLLHLVHFCVFAAATRLDGGSPTRRLAVELLLQRVLVNSARTLVGGLVGLVLLHKQVPIRGRCHTVGSQHVFRTGRAVSLVAFLSHFLF